MSQSTPYNTDQAWLKVSKAVARKKRNHHLRMYSIYTVVLTAIVSLGYFGEGIFNPVTIASNNNSERNTEAILYLADGNEVVLKEKTSNDFNTLVKNNDTNTQKSSVAEMNTVKVPTGGNYQFILPDGTKVWLNSETELSFPTEFTAQTREVSLKGQAYFDVYHDAKHPFIVETEFGNVEVKGTVFDLKAYHNDRTMETTLVEGSVNMAVSSHEVAELQPGERVVFDQLTNSVVSEVVNTDLYTSWVKGVLVFEDKTLFDISKELERWYDVTILWEDTKLANVRYSGEFDKEDALDQVLDLLSVTGDLTFQIKEQQVIFSAK